MDPEIANDPSYRQDLLDGLRELPTLSVASETNGIFGSNGIYIQTQSQLEVVASAELIAGDGSTIFQEDAGFRLQGGASRNPEKSPKHSLSLRFRDEIGDGKLRTDLFPGSPVTSFDSLHIRARYNNNWIHSDSNQRRNTTLIRDKWIRESLLEMGNPDAGRGMYVHLYLNGLYWGVHELHERQEAAHYAAYNGGDESEYDALNGGAPADGNVVSFHGLRQIARRGDWAEITQAIDVDNYIDWMIIQRFGSNSDLKSNGNWRVAGGGSANGIWRFYSWDSERVLEGVNEGAPTPVEDPFNFYSDLLALPEFRLRFADRLQKHFYHDGALTPESTIARWNRDVDVLRNAVVAESARWGDYRRDVQPDDCTCFLYNRDEHWLEATDQVATRYLPQRSRIVLNQYRGLGLYPNVAAPELLINFVAQHGGQVEFGDLLGFADPPTGEIYYTLDGTDPRSEGGAPTGTRYQPGIDVLTLLQSTTVSARVLVNGTWSAISRADFVIAPGDETLVVSEINYHPHDPTPSELQSIPNLDDDDFEFIEVANTDDARSLNLLGMRFVNGVEFEFPDYSLAPGERAVIVKNAEAFTLRYGDSVDIIGEWTLGSLSNSGEQLELVDGTGERLFGIEYDDGDLWPISADGAGATLVWIGDFGDSSSPNDRRDAWDASHEIGGTPGTVGTPSPTVVINEIQTNSTLDQIELFNFGDVAIDIGGWYLSDTRNDLKRFTIPANVILDPDGYVVFDENALGFGLSSRGEEIWLSRPEGTRVRIVDAIEFGAAMQNTSLGRIPNGTGRLVPNSRPSLGCRNRGLETNEVVISEIHYHPGEPGLASTILDPTLTPQDLEFIEITNHSDRSINLFAAGITGGIEFAFPPGSRIEPAESLILVSFDPSDATLANRLIAFQIETGMPADATVLGPFQGRLNNDGEAVRLYRPDPNSSGDPVVVDEVVFA
ncbi:MAG: lamin tail domain-containing protein, partial [Planctomycetota bacterium]